MTSLAQVDGASSQFTIALARLGLGIYPETNITHLKSIAEEEENHTHVACVGSMDNLNTDTAVSYGDEHVHKDVVTLQVLQFSNPNIQEKLLSLGEADLVNRPAVSSTEFVRPTNAESAALTLFRNDFFDIGQKAIEHRKNAALRQLNAPDADIDDGDVVDIRMDVDDENGMDAVNADVANVDEGGKRRRPGASISATVKQPKVETVSVKLRTELKTDVVIKLAASKVARDVRFAFADRYKHLKAKDVFLVVPTGNGELEQLVPDDMCIRGLAEIKNLHVRSAVHSLKLALIGRRPHTTVANHLADSHYLRPAKGSAADKAVISQSVERLAKAMASPVKVIASDLQMFMPFKELIKEKVEWRKRGIFAWIGELHLSWSYEEILLQHYGPLGIFDLAEREIGASDKFREYIEKASNYEQTMTFIRRSAAAVQQRMLIAFDEFCQEFKAEKNAHQYEAFVARRCSEDVVFRLFSDYLVDATAVIGHQMAVRSGNFELRNACFKHLGPLSFVRGKHNYQKLFVEHAADLVQFPTAVIELMSTCFAVTMTGHEYSCLGLDESHEHGPNKEGKPYLQNMSIQHFDQMLSTFGFVLASRENFLVQMGQGRDVEALKSRHLWEGDVDHFVKILGEALRSKGQRSVVENVFTKVQASPQVQKSYLFARDIAMERMDRYIKKNLLYENPGVWNSDLPKFKASLPVLAPPKSKMSRADRNVKVLQSNMKAVHQMFLKVNENITNGGEINLKEFRDNVVQALRLGPLQFLNPADNTMTKGTKSKFPEKLANVLELTTTVFAKLPLPVGVVHILDALVALFVPPSADLKTWRDYCTQFAKDHVYSRLRDGVWLSMVFDKGVSLPKLVERQRRRATNKPRMVVISLDARMPTNWSAVVSYDPYRKEIIEMLAKYCFEMPLPEGRYLAWDSETSIWLRCGVVRLQHDCLENRNTEADFNVFFHARIVNENFFPGLSVVFTSVDTDVLMYALALAGEKVLSQQLFVQKSHTELAYVAPIVAKLQERFGSLACASVLALYCLSGCDYTSNWVGVSALDILSAFDEHRDEIGDASVAAGGSISLVTMIDGRWCIDRVFCGLLTCIFYLRKHKAKVVDKTPLRDRVKNCDNKFEATYENVKTATLGATLEQQHTIPSLAALDNHRKRAEFALAALLLSTLDGKKGEPDVLQYGYGLRDPTKGCEAENLLVIWDEVFSTAVAPLPDAPKCGCTKGCTMNCCKCHAKGVVCADGCKCTNCQNGTGKQQSTEPVRDTGKVRPKSSRGIKQKASAASVKSSAETSSASSMPMRQPMAYAPEIEEVENDAHDDVEADGDQEYSGDWEEPEKEDDEADEEDDESKMMQEMDV